MSWSLADSTSVLAVCYYVKPCCSKLWVEINEEVVKRNEPMTFSQFETHMLQFCEFAGIFFAKSTHIDDYTKNTKIVVSHQHLTLGPLLLSQNTGLRFH